MSHIIAVETYGSQRVRAANGMVSAYKIGYTTAGAAVLQALYGAKAQNVTPSRARYHYVQLTGVTSIRSGYLLYALTDEELQTVESLTRRHDTSRSGCWLWRDSKWWRFPTANSGYAQAVGREGPGFNPAGFRPVVPETGKKADTTDGIRAERSQRSLTGRVWWWLTGDTYPHRELLKRQHCRWSKGRRTWYYIGETLPDTVQALVTEWADEQESPEISVVQSVDEDAPCSDQEAERILGVKLASKATSLTESTPVQSPEETPQTEASTLEDPPTPLPVRIIKPENLPAEGEKPNAVQTAIQEAKHKPLSIPSRTAQPSNKLTSIAQAYVGELTGSITGNVYCYGFATYNGILLYLNAAGPRMAVEAIRARLSKGETVNLVPWDAPAIELSPGETDGKANSGMYTTYLQTIPEAKFTSAILAHECLVELNYKGKSVTGIFRTSEEQAMAKLLHHVRQLVNIPVFDAWSTYLYSAGTTAGLVRKARSGGEIDLVVIELDRDSWTRLVTGGLANHVIALPVDTGVNP